MLPICNLIRFLLFVCFFIFCDNHKASPANRPKHWLAPTEHPSFAIILFLPIFLLSNVSFSYTAFFDCQYLFMANYFSLHLFHSLGKVIWCRLASDAASLLSLSLQMSQQPKVKEKQQHRRQHQQHCQLPLFDLWLLFLAISARGDVQTGEKIERERKNKNANSMQEW